MNLSSPGSGLNSRLKLLCLRDIRPFFQADLSVRHHDDGGFALDRASLLTVSAAVAPGGDHHRPPIPLHRSKNNGIVRTDLIADQAHLVLGPDQAHLLAQDGRSDLGMGFFIQRQRTDRLGRADLAADVAVRLARRHPQIQLRGPEARQPGFPEAGLKGIGHAGFHAFPAADAGAQKFGFGKRPGRPDELTFALKGCIRGLDQIKPKVSPPARE